MRFFLTLAGCWFAGLSSGMAQGVTVELALNQEYFFAHEALPVKVRITNFSGQRLELGKEEDWLTFVIEGRNNFIVSRLAEVLVKGDYALESSKTGTITVDLAPYFDLSRPGRYTVTASVKIPQWQQVIRSGGRSFDIIMGSKLWEQEFGMPQVENSIPEVRKYALLQANHLKELKLYFRLSDASHGRVLRVFPIGSMVSLSKPEPQLDKYSNVHILYQMGARTFTYVVINPDGLVIARETYEISKSRPALQADGDGRIRVLGGTRRVTASDLPPPPLSSTAPSDVKPPQP